MASLAGYSLGIFVSALMGTQTTLLTVYFKLNCAPAANQTFKIDGVTGYVSLICPFLFYSNRHAYGLARCK